MHFTREIDILSPPRIFKIIIFTYPSNIQSQEEVQVVLKNDQFFTNTSPNRPGNGAIDNPDRFEQSF